MPNQRRRYGVLFAFYDLGFIGTLAALLFIARHYAPYDSSSLVFLHPRLPGVHDDRALFSGVTLVWFIAFFALVLLLIRDEVRITPVRLAALLSIQAVAGAALVMMPISVDSDQFAYVGYAYAADAGNPYAGVPLTAKSPPTAVEVAKHWGNPLPLDRYGPIWTRMNAGILSLAASRDAQGQATILRIVALVAAGLCTVLIGLMLPESRIGIAAAFALNPMVLLETANGAHNEIFLVLAGLAALFLLRNDRFAAAGAMLAVAGAIKFAYFPFIMPLAAWTYYRTRRVAPVALTIAAFVAVTILGSAPFGWAHGALLAPFELLHHEHGILARLSPLATVAESIALIALTLEAARGRVSPWLVAVTALLLLAIPGKLEAWYPMIAAPLLLLPSRIATLAFLACSALGIVVAESAFLNGFPLAPSLAVAAGTAYVGFVFLSRPLTGLHLGYRTPGRRAN